MQTLVRCIMTRATCEGLSRRIGYGMRGPRNTSCAATCWYVAPRSGLDNLGVKYDTRAEVREV